MGWGCFVALGSALLAAVLILGVNPVPEHRRSLYSVAAYGPAFWSALAVIQASDTGEELAFYLQVVDFRSVNFSVGEGAWCALAGTAFIAGGAYRRLKDEGGV